MKRRAKIQFLVVIVVMSVLLKAKPLNTQTETYTSDGPELETINKKDKNEHITDKNNEKKLEQVEKKDLTERVRVGGFSQIPIDQLSQEQKKIVSFVQERKPQLKEAQLNKYQEQIVAGLNTRLTYKKQDNGQNTQYNVVVYTRAWENYRQISQFQQTMMKKTDQSFEQSGIRTKNDPNQKSWEFETVKILFGEHIENPKEKV